MTTNTLTAERLSTLRHDLRTPFNQIIGYAGMTGEDAENAGDTPVMEAAASVVASAYAALDIINEAVQRDVSAVTEEGLATLREAVAPAMQKLSSQTATLTSAAASTAVGDAAKTLNNLNVALTQLQQLLAATEHWHDETAAVTHTASPCNAVAVAAAKDVPTLVVEEVAYTPLKPSKNATILIVDDHVENRDLLRQRLQREGFDTREAADGREALAALETAPVDLVLLDVLMPGMDGIEVLQRIKSTDTLKATPVIMISALNEIEKVVQCIESGAEDYLSKPFNPVLLRARIGVTLERKRLREEDERQRDQMKLALDALAEERQKAHDLLLNILPASVAEDLQAGHCAPMYFEDTTICFTDFVGFTLSTENMAAEHVVEELHTYFTAFDRVMERYGLEKLKTIGDSYMFASGLPNRHPGHPVNALLAALELAEETERLSNRPNAPGWQLRIGLHTGPVIAGVVGIRKFAFDIWGDSVNFASRMESSGAAGRVNVSERTYARIKDFLQCEHRGKVLTKDKREVDMYFVNGVQPALIADGTTSAFDRRYKLYFGQQPPSFPQFLLKGKR